MLNIVTMPKAERAALLQLCAIETGLQEAIVKKDLWVCYLLGYPSSTRARVSALSVRSPQDDAALVRTHRVAGRHLRHPARGTKDVSQDLRPHVLGTIHLRHAVISVTRSLSSTGPPARSGTARRQIPLWDES